MLAATTPPPYRPLSLSDYEELARERLSHVAWEYYNSGSADQLTLQWNVEAFTRIRLKPRVLIDVSAVDTHIELFGQKMAHPIMLAPTSTHAFAHPEGEIATVRGAGEAAATMIASTMSNRSLEEIVKAAATPLWFQLYVDDDRDVTEMLIQRAEAAGYRVLCVTVDNTAHYARNRQGHAMREGMSQLYFANLDVTAGPGGQGRKGGRSRLFAWKDLDWIRSLAKAPIVLKGILNPDDAEMAVDWGADGIVVSNHGGRALDSVPATIEALGPVAERLAGRIPVLVDGGIRRGTDVLKALALGASAVLIGRPYLYGLAVAGSDGVRDVVNILRTEFEAAMALTGRISIGEIDRSVIW